MNAHMPPAADEEPAFDTLLGDVERFEALIGHWEESQRSVAFAYRQALDALQKAAFRKLIAEVKAAPGALDALRQAAANPVVYGVLRYHGLTQPTQPERREKALASVRPTLTFVAGVKRAIEDHCPEIKQVRQVKSAVRATGGPQFTSPFFDKGVWTTAIVFDTIPEGGVASASVEGTPLLFARKEGVVTCFHDACAHLGLPVSNGPVADGFIRCPYHGFKYDLSTGECLTAPEVQLRPIPVRVDGNRVEVRLEI